MELDRAQLYRSAYLRSVAPDAMHSLEDGIHDVMLGKVGAVILVDIPRHEKDYVISVMERYLIEMGYIVRVALKLENKIETKPSVYKITINL